MLGTPLRDTDPFPLAVGRICYSNFLVTYVGSRLVSIISLSRPKKKGHTIHSSARQYLFFFIFNGLEISLYTIEWPQIREANRFPFFSSALLYYSSSSCRLFSKLICLCFFLLFRIEIVGGQESGHDVRQLQDDDDDAVATQPQRRAGLQRLRTLLQAAQRKFRQTKLLLRHTVVYTILVEEREILSVDRDFDIYRALSHFGSQHPERGKGVYCGRLIATTY